MDTSAVT